MFGAQDSVSRALVWRARWAQSRICYVAQIFDRPLWAGLIALLPYAVFALRFQPLWYASRFAYYNYLADALLHGQLYLRLPPRSTHDLSIFEGHLYLYWPPMPA